MKALRAKEKEGEQKEPDKETAAAAAKLGMSCHILLEDRTGSNDENYKLNGNVL